MKHYLDTILLLILGIALIMWAIPSSGAAPADELAPYIRACTLAEIDGAWPGVAKSLDQDAKAIQDEMEAVGANPPPAQVQRVRNLALLLQTHWYTMTGSLPLCAQLVWLRVLRDRYVENITLWVIGQTIPDMNMTLHYENLVLDSWQAYDTFHQQTHTCQYAK